MLQGSRVTAVGVDMDLSTVGLPPDFRYGSPDKPCPQNRLALATLAEADHWLRRLLQMRDGERHNVLHRRRELDPIVRRRDVVQLLRDAAHALRVARHRHGDRHLVPAVEEVLGGVAAVVHGAVPVVRQQPVVRLGRDALRDNGGQIGRVVHGRVPASTGVEGETGGEQAAVHFRHSGVAKERHVPSSRVLLIRRSEEARISRGQECGHRPSPLG